MYNAVDNTKHYAKEKKPGECTWHDSIHNELLKQKGIREALGEQTLPVCRIRGARHSESPLQIFAE